MRRPRTLPLASGLAGLALLLVGTATEAAPPSVLVFCERGFPYFAANQAASPRVLAETLGEPYVFVTPSQLAHLYRQACPD